jgi:transcriptional regulator with XRE-family HTH domain
MTKTLSERLLELPREFGLNTTKLIAECGFSISTYYGLVNNKINACLSTIEKAASRLKLIPILFYTHDGNPETLSVGDNIKLLIEYATENYVGNSFKKHRKLKSFTQNDLCGITGIYQSRYCLIENNKVNPKVSTIEMIASVLGLNTAYFTSSSVLRPDKVKRAYQMIAGLAKNRKMVKSMIDRRLDELSAEQKFLEYTASQMN